jgi:hypothetical protein
MPNKKHLAIQRSEFFCDLIFPRLILGVICTWHRWIPYVVVCSPQYILQIFCQFSIFLVCSLPATVNEQHSSIHSIYFSTWRSRQLARS